MATQQAVSGRDANGHRKRPPEVLDAILKNDKVRLSFFGRMSGIKKRQRKEAELAIAEARMTLSESSSENAELCRVRDEVYQERSQARYRQPFFAPSALCYPAH